MFLRTLAASITVVGLPFAGLASEPSVEVAQNPIRTEDEVDQCTTFDIPEYFKDFIHIIDRREPTEFHGYSSFEVACWRAMASIECNAYDPTLQFKPNMERRTPEERAKRRHRSLNTLLANEIDKNKEEFGMRVTEFHATPKGEGQKIMTEARRKRHDRS
jgi:hypothetical protein